MKYSFLEAKITERGIKKAAISAAIGVTPKSFNNKLAGKSPFTWPEVQTISPSPCDTAEMPIPRCHKRPRRSRTSP